MFRGGAFFPDTVYLYLYTWGLGSFQSTENEVNFLLLPGHPKAKKFSASEGRSPLTSWPGALPLDPAPPQNPVIRSRSTLAMCVYRTFFDLATPLSMVYSVQGKTNYRKGRATRRCEWERSIPISRLGGWILGSFVICSRGRVKFKRGVRPKCGVKRINSESKMRKCGVQLLA